MFLLFRLDIAGVTLQGEVYAFVRYFKVTEPIDEIDTALNCLYLRRTTEDDMSHTL